MTKYYKCIPSLNENDTQFYIHQPTQTGRGWLHEDMQDRETLLVAVGDSWTWGDSIFDIDIPSNIVDDPRRVTAIYGAKLAESFNSDFVNIAECGGNNVQMLKRLDRILAYNYEKYKKIRVIITLTEVGRELANFQEYSNDNTNINEFLKEVERKVFMEYKSLFEKYSNTTFFIGRNFTYSFEENINIIEKYHLDKTWIDVLNDHIQEPYPTDLRLVTSMAIRPIERIMTRKNNLDAFKEYLVDEYSRIYNSSNWLMKSKFNHKKATKHPTVEGHKLWADYLYDQFNRTESE